MQGLDYLHFNNTLHGDLKPANLLRSSEGRIKIADFGSALVYLESEDTYDGPMNGTPAFRAPETLLKQRKLTSKVQKLPPTRRLSCLHYRTLPCPSAHRNLSPGCNGRSDSILQLA